MSTLYDSKNIIHKMRDFNLITCNVQFKPIWCSDLRAILLSPSSLPAFNCSLKEAYCTSV